MFDKHGFYFTKESGFKKYNLDIGASINLQIPQNEYIIYHKRRFFKKNTNELQKGMALLTENQNIDFNFDETFFKYGLTYYQRNGQTAFIKGGNIEELELYQDLYKIFGLNLKLRKYLQIEGDYPTIEEIQNNIKYIKLDQAISFLLALATIYGDWNLIEEENNVFLGSILIKFPFDSSLMEYQDIIFQIEDILIKNKIYNKLSLTKKQDFMWNIYDKNLLEIMGKSILIDKLKIFYNIDEKILPLFDRKISTLKGQLSTDLRIILDNFKLVEIEGISSNF